MKSMDTMVEGGKVPWDMDQYKVSSSITDICDFFPTKGTNFNNQCEFVTLRKFCAIPWKLFYNGSDPNYGRIDEGKTADNFESFVRMFTHQRSDTL